MIEIQTDGDSILLRVKVVPGASRTRLMGEWEGRLKIAVAAPPERGKANDAVTTLLAKVLKIRKRDVCVVGGESSPLKAIRIVGLRADAVRAALQSAAS